MEQKERYAESYKITQAIHIGTSEIVIGIDMKAKDNMYYMVADYENNGIFEKYNNALVSDSYTEIRGYAQALLLYRQCLRIVLQQWFIR